MTCSTKSAGPLPGGLQDDVGVFRNFIGTSDARKIGQFAGTRQLVKTLRVARFANPDRRIWISMRSGFAISRLIAPSRSILMRKIGRPAALFSLIASTTPPSPAE